MRRRKLKVGHSAQPVSLVEFLADALSLSKRKAKQIVDSRNVFVNERRTWMATHKLVPDDLVEIHSHDETTTDETMLDSIVFENDHFLILNKPAGLVSNGPRSAEAKLQWLFSSKSILAVHRLDRDTTGCLLFAKDERAQGAAERLFKDRVIQKTYTALVEGYMPQRTKIITTPIEGRPAVTKVTPLRSKEIASLVEVKIETGRTHQIRIHLAQIGHPILGDKQYVVSEVADPALRSVNRQMLHASSLSFTDPATRKLIRATAPLPGDMKGCMKLLGIRLK